MIPALIPFLYTLLKQIDKNKLFLVPKVPKVTIFYLILLFLSHFLSTIFLSLWVHSSTVLVFN